MHLRLTHANSDILHCVNGPNGSFIVDDDDDDEADVIGFGSCDSIAISIIIIDVVVVDVKDFVNFIC